MASVHLEDADFLIEQRSQGTVKFHVNNILRKLHAGNRAEAASRYLRLTGGGAPHDS